MERASNLRAGWPIRQIDIDVEGLALRLRVPDNPYAMLDLPAVEQAFQDDGYMPYWAFLWPAGMMLATWLIRQSRAGALSPPGPVLEIGCGLGVAGLSAAKLGYEATLADYDADAVEFAQDNARLNGLKAAACQLDWRDRPIRRYQIILGADLLYEQRNHQPILEFLRLSLACGGLAALSDPSRQAADEFVRLAPSAGWLVESADAQWQNTGGRIITMRRS